MAGRKKVVSVVLEKYILKQSIHFGFLKLSFRAGSIIEVNRTNNCIIVDGMTYNDVRDADICIRHRMLVPYSDEEAQDARRMEAARQAAARPPVEKQNRPPPMKIVQSDQDLMERELNIDDLRPDVKAARERKATAEANRKTGDLSIIRETSAGDIRGIPVQRASAAGREDYEEVALLDAETVGATRRAAAAAAGAEQRTRPLPTQRGAPLPRPTQGDLNQASRPTPKFRPNVNAEAAAARAAQRKAEATAKRNALMAAEGVTPPPATV